MGIGEAYTLQGKIVNIRNQCFRMAGRVKIQGGEIDAGIAFLERSIETDPGNAEGARWADMHIHRISSDLMKKLGYSSKLNAEWEFLTMLRDEGRRAAEAFLDAHANDIGSRSTLDLAHFLGPV